VIYCNVTVVFCILVVGVVLFIYNQSENSKMIFIFESYKTNQTEQ